MIKCTTTPSNSVTSTKPIRSWSNKAGNLSQPAAPYWWISLTNSINLIHKDDAWLMVPCIVEHFSDQPCTLTNVLVYYGAGHHLQGTHTKCSLEKDFTATSRKEFHDKLGLLQFKDFTGMMASDWWTSVLGDTVILQCLHYQVKACCRNTCRFSGTKIKW